MRIYPVIICGGQGTRLWPLSRKSYPKQFINLVDEQSLLQATVLRISNRDIFAAPLIVTNQAYQFLVKSQLAEIHVEDYSMIIEGQVKNTAPAIALAAMQSIDSKSVMLVMPSDHYIKDVHAFELAISEAYQHAVNGNIVTFGMQATAPETGYGYIKIGDEISTHTYQIDKFIEKPDRERALEFVKDDNYAWNSGIFLMRADIYLNELKKYRNDIYKCCLNTYKQSLTTSNIVTLDDNAFKLCPAESIDYAVMEKTKLACVVKASMGWSDIGSWQAVWQVSKQCQFNNAVNGDVILRDCEGTYISASKNNLVAAIGMKDVMLIQTGNATLLMPKNRVQEVKNIVNELEQRADHRVEFDNHVVRPWGAYEVYADSAHFKVKKIIVKSGQKLSLQSHKFRAEHWVVVKGIATVTKGVDIIELKENQSIYIETNELHRLENKQSYDLEIIEVQTGSYLGEDDIVRYEDIYGRSIDNAQK